MYLQENINSNRRIILRVPMFFLKKNKISVKKALVLMYYLKILLRIKSHCYCILCKCTKAVYQRQPRLMERFENLYILCKRGVLKIHSFLLVKPEDNNKVLLEKINKDTRLVHFLKVKHK